MKFLNPTFQDQFQVFLVPKNFRFFLGIFCQFFSSKKMENIFREAIELETNDRHFFTYSTKWLSTSISFDLQFVLTV